MVYVYLATPSIRIRILGCAKYTYTSKYTSIRGVLSGMPYTVYYTVYVRYNLYFGPRRRELQSSFCVSVRPTYLGPKFEIRVGPIRPTDPPQPTSGAPGGSDSFDRPTLSSLAWQLWVGRTNFFPGAAVATVELVSQWDELL